MNAVGQGQVAYKTDFRREGCEVSICQLRNGHLQGGMNLES